MAVYKITPAQLAQQWRGVRHKFDVAKHNFEVRIAKEAVEEFQNSFKTKSFSSSPKRSWAPWQGKYKGKQLMIESGALQRSIKLKSIKPGAKTDEITVFTDPAAFRSRPKRHKGFCYAAVHNNLSQIANKPVFGPKVERQFIGDDSTILERKTLILGRDFLKAILSYDS